MMTTWWSSLCTVWAASKPLEIAQTEIQQPHWCHGLQCWNPKQASYRLWGDLMIYYRNEANASCQWTKSRFDHKICWTCWQCFFILIQTDIANQKVWFVLLPSLPKLHQHLQIHQHDRHFRAQLRFLRVAICWLKKVKFLVFNGNLDNFMESFWYTEFCSWGVPFEFPKKHHKKPGWEWLGSIYMGTKKPGWVSLWTKTTSLLGMQTRLCSACNRDGSPDLRFKKTSAFLQQIKLY